MRPHFPGYFRGAFATRRCCEASPLALLQEEHRFFAMQAHQCRKKQFRNSPHFWRRNRVANMPPLFAYRKHRHGVDRCAILRRKGHEIAKPTKTLTHVPFVPAASLLIDPLRILKEVPIFDPVVS